MHIEHLECRKYLAIAINFDYRFDTTGFFDVERQRVLEVAALHVGERLSNPELPAIIPSGVDSWTARLADPTTGTGTSVKNLRVGADELVVFVGARDLPGNYIGMASFGSGSSG